MKTIQSKNVLFVTGAFVSNACWDEWKSYFESKGYATQAPAWLQKDAPAAELRRRHPDAGVASVRLKALVDHYVNIAKQMPEKPIVIGHSLGGLITQILVNRYLAAAGIAIHSVPPQGIIPTQWSFYKATWKSLGFFTSTKKTYMMSFKDWQYAFTNGMPLEAQKESYDRLAIPESKLCLRDGLTSAAHVDFKKAHAPLLLLAGTTDHCIPASLNTTNFKRYKDQNSVTELKVMEGRNHYVLGQPTWKEDAGYILNWIDEH